LVAAIGITNQRETLLALDKTTKQPLSNAIVWHDTRTRQIVNQLLKTSFSNDSNKFQLICGLPLTT